jgi:enoyl-CoA hydratase/carnithine racemase
MCWCSASTGPRARNALNPSLIRTTGAAVLSAEADPHELVRLAAFDASAVPSRLEHWRAVVFAGEDACDGVRAFVKKREPDWQGP